MDHKVPDEEEKKNLKKYSLGCHNPFLILAHPL